MTESGQCRVFHKYLEARYADIVVLTFGQIEDLLGFSLPAAARTDPAWWTNVRADSADPTICDAWTLAHRTARPNLMARNVRFERV
jgi:hypothetical protein